jgi:hypothetical protein
VFHEPSGPSWVEHELLQVSFFDAQQPFRQ